MLATILCYGAIWTLLYCLIALGFSLLFSVAQVINLAHGAIIIAACYATFFLVTVMNWPAGFGFIGGILTSVALIFIAFAFIRKLLTAPHASALLLTVGLGDIIQQIIILTMGTESKYVPSIFDKSFKFLDVVISYQQLLTVIVSGLLIAILAIFLQYTKLGKAIRAVTQDSDTAALSGINAEKMYLVTIFIAGVLSGTAGILVAPLQSVTPGLAVEMIVIAFTVTILAGLGGPIWGIVVAAAIVAYSELLTAFLIAPSLKEAAAFTIMVLTLMFKPSGLFGRART
jgi:branched-chain amino acid transport system permease protein